MINGCQCSGCRLGLDVSYPDPLIPKKEKKEEKPKIIPDNPEWSPYGRFQDRK
jgi:hypothetical protein